MQPLVSIIIPTYDRAHLIGETLESVIAQTYQNWECIVVDDGSTDYTDELMEFYCEKDTRFQYFRRLKSMPKGANFCRNYGLRLSIGTYIQWFDSDDLMDHNKLKIQVKALDQSNYNYSVCQSLVFSQKITNIIGLRHNKIISQNPFRDYLKAEIVWMTPSALWKRKSLDNLDHLFDENLQAAQEWEFHSRVLSGCNNYHVIEKPLVYIRQHEDSLTYNDDHENRIWNYFLARLKIYRNPDIALDVTSTMYLQDYLLKNFKGFIRSLSLKNSVKSLYYHIYTDKNFELKTKIFASLSVISYLLFNKGYFFLKRVNYKRC